jgi:3D (Asp-Asp-Asp) domain-containing protein
MNFKEKSMDKIKNTVLTIGFGILLYFYCLLTFYTLPNIKINNTKENITNIEEELLIIEEPVVIATEIVTDPPEEWIDSIVTAYCACMECCGKTNGITASGTHATAGRTIAMSKDYRFGTKVEIEGYGIYTVEDRGGAIKGTRIDVFFDTHKEALQFGKKRLRFRIVE